MSILWCGGEDIDFPNGQPVLVSTSTTDTRSDYARCCVFTGSYTRLLFWSNGIGSITYPCWLSGQAYINSTNSFVYDGVIFGLVDSTGKGLILSKHSGKASLDTWNGSSFSNLATESGTTFSNVSGVYKIDMYVEDYDTNVNVKVYIDGSLIIDFTGDVTVSGVSSLTSFASGGGSGASYLAMSELILADEDTRSMSLKTLAPNASGDSNDWTNDYDAIDEVTCSDADLMYDNAVNDQALVNLTGMPAGSFQIKAVKLTARAIRTSDSTPTSLNLGVKSGGSVDVADNHSLSTSWESFERLMAVNPITTSAFSSSEIDALQLALKAAA